jgi:hypothetical protein
MAPAPSRTPRALDLGWYGAAATGVVFLAAPEAGAQVVYTDLDPDVVVSGGDYLLDFDEDGDPELEFSETLCCGIAFTLTKRAGGIGDDNFVSFAGTVTGIGTPYGGPCYHGRAMGTSCEARWLPLEDGHVVSAPDVLSPIVHQQFTLSAQNTNGWNEAGPAYIGLRFRLVDGSTVTHHLGWVGVEIPPEGGEIRIRDYAYEATPDAPIEVGLAAFVAMTGSVNQTTFPPEGGILRYTATVTNTSDEPIPLDLWVAARRDGILQLRRLLGSGKLPPVAIVRWTVSVNVPANAPPGEYRVYFHVGEFETQAKYASQNFTITKESAAGVAIADASEVLAAAAAPGDLFASANAAEATVTHALNAPVPNPSDGRAAMTLSVAEAQHVTVAVYDALGRRVAVLHDGLLDEGPAHQFVFDGSALPAGVYAVCAVGETFTDVRTLTLAR